MDTTTTAKAQTIWQGLDNNERTAVRFGMLPLQPMEEATGQGYDPKDLAVALMTCAEQDGGMVA